MELMTRNCRNSLIREERTKRTTAAQRHESSQSAASARRTYIPAMMFPIPKAKRRPTNRTLGHLSVRLPPRQHNVALPPRSSAWRSTIGPPPGPRPRRFPPGRAQVNRVVHARPGQAGPHAAIDGIRRRGPSGPPSRTLGRGQAPLPVGDQRVVRLADVPHAVYGRPDAGVLGWVLGLVLVLRRSGGLVWWAGARGLDFGLCLPEEVEPGLAGVWVGWTGRARVGGRVCR